MEVRACGIARRRAHEAAAPSEQQSKNKEGEKAPITSKCHTGGIISLKVVVQNRIRNEGSSRRAGVIRRSPTRALSLLVFDQLLQEFLFFMLYLIQDCLSSVDPVQ